MNKIGLLISMLFLFPLFAFADVYDFPKDIRTISSEIPKLESVKCKFRQEKYIKNVSKPIISSGDFEFKKGEGIYFYIKTPIEKTIDYTSNNYKPINDIINAISAQKYSRLEKEFNFYYTSDSEKWSLGMRPKKGSNAFNVISSITLAGDREYIYEVNIDQTGGNKTVIWFEK